MANWQIAVLIGGVLGLIGGWWVARKSAQKEALKGGTAGIVLHYLACSAQTAAAPTAMVGVILAHDLHLIPRILTGVGLALGCIALALILLIAQATYESIAARS